MAATTEVPSPDSPVSTSAFSFHPALAKGSDKLVTWAMLDDPTQGGTYWKLDLEENGIWDKLYDEDMVPLEISFWTSAASNDWTSSQNAAPTKKTKKSKPFENVYLRPEFEQLGGSPMKDEPATTPPSYRLDLQFDDAAVKTFLETMTTNFPDCCDGCYQTYHEVFDRGSKEIVVARYDGKPVTVWDVLTSIHAVYSKINPMTGGEDRGNIFAGISPPTPKNATQDGTHSPGISKISVGGLSFGEDAGEYM